MYWPEENVTETYGPFEVEAMLTKELSSTILVREFTLTNAKDVSSFGDIVHNIVGLLYCIHIFI